MRFDEVSIYNALSETAQRRVVFFEETDSTNVQAHRLAKEGAAHGTVVVADMQTAGRGRRGRSWLQAPGEMLALSIVLRPHISPEKTSMLTLVAALASALSIEKVTGVSCQIKWPNDIVINNKKAAGILTELQLQSSVVDYVIVGIGINVGAAFFPEEIRKTATSLYLETGKPVDRNQLLAELLCEMERLYALFLEQEDLSCIKEEYLSRLINLGREVRVLDPKGEYRGTGCGITDTGELLVRREDGSMEQIYAGEVSVRGLYTYV